MTTVNFELALGTQVRITPLTNTPGIVTGLILTAAGPEYRVRFWMDGEIKAEWCRLGELEVWPT